MRIYTRCIQMHSQSPKTGTRSLRTWVTDICWMPSLLDDAGSWGPVLMGTQQKLFTAAPSLQPTFTVTVLVTLRDQRQPKWTERRSLNMVWLIHTIQDAVSRNSCIQLLRRMSYTCVEREKQPVWDHRGTPRPIAELGHILGFVLRSLCRCVCLVFPTAHIDLHAQAVSYGWLIAEFFKVMPSSAREMLPPSSYSCTEVEGPFGERRWIFPLASWDDPKGLREHCGFPSTSAKAFVRTALSSGLFPLFFSGSSDLDSLFLFLPLFFNVCDGHMHTYTFAYISCVWYILV